MTGCLCLFPLPTFLLRISFTQRPGGLSPAVVCQKWKWRGTSNQQFPVKARNKATRPNAVFTLDDDKLRNHGLGFPPNTQSHEISKILLKEEDRWDPPRGMDNQAHAMKVPKTMLY